MEFLTNEQAAAYGRFVDAPSRADLDRLCFLDDDDRTLIGVSVTVLSPAAVTSQLGRWNDRGVWKLPV